ncbi:MAG: GvpL/GvpF family gas vesicle protein [Myxococcota bacterium]|nr:GvpL/GvpF family gas vesicle protein [Myxococcota bacterium]
MTDRPGRVCTVEPGAARDCLLYAYGFIPDGQPLPIAACPAVQGIRHAALVAVVEELPAAEFSADALATNLSNVEWGAKAARKHAAVVAEAARQGTVIPARLCTLFTDRDAVVRTLVENRHRLARLIERLRGRREWGVKVFGDDGAVRETVAATDPEVRRIDAIRGAVSPGQAYVLARKRDAVVTLRALTTMDSAAEQTANLLENLGFDLRAKPLHPVREGCVMAANLAVLVDDTRAERFHATLADLAGRLGPEGFAIEISGPWPAYSFCDEGQRDDQPCDTAEAAGAE